MIKVKFFPLQAHSLAFGGFEIQMLTLLDNLQQFSTSDIEVSKIDVWSRDSDYDIAHFWGLEPANLNNVMWAKNNGKKVVITVLLSYYEKIISLLYDKISKYIGIKKIQLEILKLVDAVVVVNDLQMKVANNIFNIEKEKIFIIPNIIHDNFLHNSKIKTASKNYILCTGSICKRKNQLYLARACAKLQKELILVGKVLPGEENYAKQVEEVVDSNSNIKWIKGLAENSEELIQLVQDCSVFALLSMSETQPISILEALAFGKKLLLSDRKFAYQSCFGNAKKINPESLESICKGINELYSDTNMPQLYDFVIEDFKGESVAKRYEEVYKNLARN